MKLNIITKKGTELSYSERNDCRDLSYSRKDGYMWPSLKDHPDKAIVTMLYLNDTLVGWTLISEFICNEYFTDNSKEDVRWSKNTKNPVFMIYVRKENRRSKIGQYLVNHSLSLVNKTVNVFTGNNSDKFYSTINGFRKSNGSILKLDKYPQLSKIMSNG